MQPDTNWLIVGNTNRQKEVQGIPTARTGPLRCMRGQHEGEVVKAMTRWKLMKEVCQKDNATTTTNSLVNR